MGRRSNVRYWASRGAYCCEFRGKQVVLAKGPDDYPNGPTFLAATKAFGQLVAGKKPATGKTLAEVWTAYSTWLKHHRKEGTLQLRRDGLEKFVARFGEEVAETLQPFRVEEWLQARREERRPGAKGRLKGWTDGTVRIFWGSLHAMLNWAIKGRMIGENPVVGVEKPRKRKRSDKVVLEPAEHLAVLNSEKSATWREYWLVLEATGSRPGEIAAASAKDYDPDKKAIVYPAQREPGEFTHKTHCHGEDRIIYLTGEALRVVERRMAEHPTGPIFGQAPKGYRIIRPGMALRRWSAKAIAAQAAKVRKRTGLRHFIPYSYRHTFVTRWVVAGRSVEKLAKLLGTSPEVVYDHYSHLFRYQADLRRELEDFRTDETLKTTGTATVVNGQGEPVTVGLIYNKDR